MNKLVVTILVSFLLVPFIAKGNANSSSQNYEAVPSKEINYKLDDYRNYLGLWCGGAKENLTFAKNMAIKNVIYLRGMEKFPESKGLRFFISDPEYITYKRFVDFKKIKSYSKAQIDDWREYCAMKDASLPFPDCMATGWFNRFNHREMKPDHPEYGYCTLIPHFQTNKNINRAVSRIMARVNELVKKCPNMKFGGFVWDVPQLDGDLWGQPKGSKRYKQCGMSLWRGVDCVSVPEGVKLDYPTFCEGRAQFYRALRKAAEKVNPDVKLIMDPARMYVQYVEPYQRIGVKVGDPALADYVQMEHGGDEYLLDKKAWASGYLQTENVATACDIYAYSFDIEIRAIGSSASVGAWSVWFGNPMQTNPSLVNVPPRLKLSRSLATWENLNNTPIEKRKWNKANLVYDSPTAHISKDALWGINPETKKMFFCFLNPNAKIKLPEGCKIEVIRPLDALFSEYFYPRVMPNFKIENGQLSLTERGKMCVGDAYSITFKK